MLRSTLRAVLLSGVAVSAACSGGGGSPTSVTAPACAGSSKFCLISCNLGCTVNGDCAVTEIAQNQQIVLNFSQVIDPNSLSNGSVQIRTASGESPAGQLFVDGNSIVFQPEARVVGGATVFGFRPNETYVLTLPGVGQGSTLTSNSGDPLDDPVVCQLNVTQGVIDVDGAPPIGELVTPSANPAAQDTVIAIRFSELIDLSTFVGTTAQTSPIRYSVRPTIVDPVDPTRRICDPSIAPGSLVGVPTASVDLSGAVPRSVISLSPSTLLPRQACIEVTVTERIRDLAGTPAAREVFEFFVEQGTPEILAVTENFASANNIDVERSAGQIGGGSAIPGRIGGSGMDGSFDPELGTRLSSNVFLFDTTNTFLPGVVRLDGLSRTVTDGRYEFTDFVIPQGTKVIFRGDAPAVITVSGTARIEGELSVEAPDLAPFFGVNSPGTPRLFQPGQAGGLPGAGGARGGKGGDSGDGLTADPAFDGSDGEPVTAPGMSGYTAALRMNTPGRGSIQFPENGMLAPGVGSFPLLFNTIALATSGGGGGGAHFDGGGPGRFVPNMGFPVSAARPQDIGPDGPGGSRLILMDVPMGLQSSLDHFLVGGSGGGGGGANILGGQTGQVSPPGGRFTAGAAGGGGGGVVCVRTGRDLFVGPGGAIQANGGSAGTQLPGGIRSTENDWPCPGGGGSGGTILLQSGRMGGISQTGTIDLRGGAGGLTRYSLLPFASEDVRGGRGGNGFVRIEEPTAPPMADLGTVLGPTTLDPLSVGALLPTERDDRTIILSRFQTIGTIFPPEFTSYEIRVREGTGPNAVIRTYTDAGDPSMYANFANGPIRFQIQGGFVSPGTTTAVDVGPFRDFVNRNAGPSINLDSATGFRWLITYDTSFPEPVEILQVVINAEG